MELGAQNTNQTWHILGSSFHHSPRPGPPLQMGCLSGGPREGAFIPTAPVLFVRVLGHQTRFGGEMGATSDAILLLHAPRDRMLITTPGCRLLLQASLPTTQYFFVHRNPICNSPK